MKVHKPYREESRLNWGCTMEETEGLTKEQIQLGAILRIADAVEKMAADHDALRKERDFQAERAKYAHEWLAKEKRSNRALRGYIKRLKGKATS